MVRFPFPQIYVPEGRTGFFEHAVNGLDERHRSIITDLLDEDMTWDIMMERYHVSHTMIANTESSIEGT